MSFDLPSPMALQIAVVWLPWGCVAMLVGLSVGWKRAIAVRLALAVWGGVWG